jgi:hypothetical protein
VFATHTAPGPAAMALGPVPTRMRATSRPLGEIRNTTPADSLVTHTAPDPNATSVGLASSPTRSVTWPVFASMPTTVWSSAFATHTTPSP